MLSKSEGAIVAPGLEAALSAWPRVDPLPADVVSLINLP
jgi:hypothetical protein